MAWFLRVLDFLKLCSPELKAEIRLCVDRLAEQAKITESPADDIAVAVLKTTMILLGLY